MIMEYSIYSIKWHHEGKISEHDATLLEQYCEKSDDGVYYIKDKAQLDKMIADMKAADCCISSWAYDALVKGLKRNFNGKGSGLSFTCLH